VNYKTSLFGAILFFFLISVACSDQGLSSMVTQRSKLETATAFPKPGNNNTYVQYDCSFLDVPARYTSQKCYWIDKPTNSFGVVYYDEGEISAVGTFVKSPAELGQSQSDFIIYWANSGGWNLSDLRDAFIGMQDMQMGDTKTYGSLIATINYDDGQLIVHVGIWP
jgi:hypothetical protein